MLSLLWGWLHLLSTCLILAHSVCTPPAWEQLSSKCVNWHTGDVQQQERSPRWTQPESGLGDQGGRGPRTQFFLTQSPTRLRRMEIAPPTARGRKQGRPEPRGRGRRGAGRAGRAAASSPAEWAVAEHVCAAEAAARPGRRECMPLPGQTVKPERTWRRRRRGRAAGDRLGILVGGWRAPAWRRLWHRLRTECEATGASPLGSCSTSWCPSASCSSTNGSMCTTAFLTWAWPWCTSWSPGWACTSARNWTSLPPKVSRLPNSSSWPSASAASWSSPISLCRTTP